MDKTSKAIALLFVVAAVVFAAGCAQKATTPANENVSPTDENVSTANETMTPVNGTMTPANVAMETGQLVTGDDSGKTISLKKGENLTIILRENPSTGTSWKLNMSEGLSILSNYYTQDPAHKGVGVPVNHTWIIQAVSPGSQFINGIYKRPWENTTGTEQNFTLNVEIV